MCSKCHIYKPHQFSNRAWVKKNTVAEAVCEFKCGIDVIYEFRSRIIKSLSSSRLGRRDPDAEDEAL